MQSHTLRLWYNRDGSRNVKGTDELCAFVMKVYEALIKEQNKVLGGTQIQSKCSLQLFWRIDVAVIWDIQDKQFRYTVSEVQEGRCGLLGLGYDARMTIPNAFVAAIERGALHG